MEHIIIQFKFDKLSFASSVSVNKIKMQMWTFLTVFTIVFTAALADFNAVSLILVLYIVQSQMFIN
jgi:hypothetical protein